MFIPKQTKLASALLGIAVALCATSSQAQDAARPDLGGVWTNASLTSLTRPNGIEALVLDQAISMPTHRLMRPLELRPRAA